MLRTLRDTLTGAHRFAEFLPDAEGVIERRHSPVAGLLILAVVVMFGGVLAWAALTEVEQMVSAQGQVKPAARVKLVNHPDGGRVAEVHVAEGQHVPAGAPLVTFDAELVSAELAEFRGRWQVRSAEVARLRAEATGAAFRVDPGLAAERPDLVRDQEELLTTRRQSQASHADALAQAIERRAREAKSLTAELRRLENSHALVSQQLEAVKGLAEKGLYPRLRLVTVERSLSDIAGDASRTRAQLEAAEAALAEARSRREALDQEWRAQVLGELAIASAERDRLAEALRRHEALVRNLVVRAPVEGIVQELAVTTPGQSVGSNQPLMKLVPTGGGLVIEARVANRDMAYVRAGQPAKVKVLAYDFLRFGTLAGRLERIAADAVADPETGALTYEIEVVTGQAELASGAERFPVVPGMAVEVDLLAGERTILSYLTDRILRTRAAAFREG